VKTSDQINEIAAALAKAQRAMKPAVKDSTNPHFKSHYADLASCWDACRDALTANNLSVIQGASADGERVTVTTLLLHSSGQWVQDALTSAARDAGAQSVGSAITYGRRYGLCAMVGIAPEDDDAEAAQGRNGNGRTVASAPVVKTPDGYANWLAEMQAVADEGVDRLRDEWKTQPAAFREHLTKHDTAAYETLRERAKRSTVAA
jgi:hypothetical protein